MKKKIIWSLFVVTLFSLTIIGCSKSKPTNAESDRLREEIEVLTERNANLQEAVNDSDKKYRSLETKVKDQVSIIEMFKENKQNDKYELLPAYTANVDTYKQEIGFYMVIPKDKTLIQKLNMIGGELSKYYFNDLPIEVVRIDEVKGKKVAVVNLKESKDNQGIKDASMLKSPAWATEFLQGSAGGIITEDRLIGSFLQKEYKGEWIDGVKFLYNNDNVNFQHTPTLAEISYK
ncbi:hypothetical protein [uncultured Clostridium sp.]|uniref:hypothetical protein n=1 Tax=uncultured Clostridium sp. TaxID=59620 RepID=UPI0028EDA273|nr:hypothetical protein [uncultured Clostridium sp.]